MATSTDRNIAILNDLVEVTLDSAYGYEEAAKAAKNPAFKSLFEKRSIDRDRITVGLQQEVRGLGGVPDENGSVLASAHRKFLSLKNTVLGSDQSVIDEVEAGEDHIKSKFEGALGNQELSPTIKGKIYVAYAAIKADHDQMRDLKRDLMVRPSI